MHLTEPVSILITGILASAMVHRLVLIAPLRQPAIDAILVGVDQTSRQDRLLDQRLDGSLLDVVHHVDDHLPAALDHPQDRRLFLLARATPRCPLQASTPGRPVFFLTASGCPLCPAMM